MTDASESNEVAFDVPTTLADYAAFLRWITRRPRRLAFEIALYLALALLFVVFQIVIGLVTAAFTARHGPADATRHYLAAGLRQDLSDSWPIIAAVVGGIFLLNLIVIAPLQCRRLAARLLAGYPESTVGHPTPTLVSHVRLDAGGAETGTRNERVFLAWPLLTRLAETPRYLFLMCGSTAGVIVPKGAVDAADLERVRTICRRFLAAPGSPEP